MALMNYKVAIVYTSVTGNTTEVAHILYEVCKLHFQDVDMYIVNEFQRELLGEFDAIIVGSYTWGNGEIPNEMIALYKAFETFPKKSLVTGVFGTGDCFYPRYCGAVDEFRNMLYVHTTLAATLKIELLPQLKDIERCSRFIESIAKRLGEKVLTPVIY
jgi:flavodoxin I